VKREKYDRDRFKLLECEAFIDIFPKGKEDPGFATAFLNIRLPDGRWLPFKMAEGARTCLYKPQSNVDESIKGEKHEL